MRIGKRMIEALKEARRGEGTIHVFLSNKECFLVRCLLEAELQRFGLSKPFVDRIRKLLDKFPLLLGD